MVNKHTRLEGSLTTGRHNRDNEMVELIGRQECAKIVKDFNKETARYRSLVIGLGGSHDSARLREELKRTRQKAYGLAKQNKTKLLPHFRIGRYEKQELEEFERLWIIFSTCLDVLQNQMYKTLRLEKLFPIHSDKKTLFINTGIIDPMGGHKSCAISIEPIDMSADRRTLEREELRLLRSEILEIENMISEMDQHVDIKPWAVEPELDSNKIAECTSSLNSASERSTPVAGEVVSVYSQERQRRKKCIFLVAVILLSVIVIATVLGVCVAVLR